ncbi:MAG: ABC transporter permease [Chloroflexi bacterium]|nr:ABC transporter permease [Chloroflexota bacterium]
MAHAETQTQTQPRAPTFSVTLLQRRPELILIPLVFVVVMLVWEYGVQLLRVEAFILPPPSAIWRALVRGLSAAPNARDGYWLHAWITLSEALSGFVVGSTLGILLGTLISQSRLMELTLKPYLVAVQSLPKVAIAPLFVIWFGFGMESKVIICSLLTFFPLLVNSVAGFHGVDTERVELMKGLAATRWQIFTKVAFPSALPFIFAGLDMAIVYSVLGAIVGEFVGAQRGLGVLILQMNFAMDVAGAFSVFVVLSALGIGLSSILNVVRSRVLFWAPSERTQRTTGA